MESVLTTARVGDKLRQISKLEVWIQSAQQSRLLDTLTSSHPFGEDMATPCSCHLASIVPTRRAPSARDARLRRFRAITTNTSPWLGQPRLRQCLAKNLGSSWENKLRRLHDADKRTDQMLTMSPSCSKATGHLA